MSFFKNLFGDDDALMAPSPDYSRTDPKVALQETLSREAELKKELKRVRDANKVEVDKLNARVHSVQTISTRLADDAKLKSALIEQLQLKSKENANTIKSMEQQSSQAFKLADQLREKQREVAKLQEQLKNTSGAASAAPKADNGAEVTALKRRIAELEDASSRTSADAKKAQTELSNIKRQLPTLLDATALQSLLQSAESLDVPAPSSRPGSRSISRTPSSDQLSGMTQPSIEAFSFGIAAPSDTKVFEAPTSQRRDPRLSYENVGKLERELRRAQASAAKLSAQVTSLGGVPAANVSDASVDVVSADVLALKLKIESLESELRSASEKATVQPVEVVQQLPITDNSDAIISALKQQISELEQSAATHNSQSQQAAELQAEINALQSELKDKQQRVTQFESEVRSLEMQMKQDDKSQVLIELNASLSTMQSQLIALQSQLNESHARSEQLESSLQSEKAATLMANEQLVQSQSLVDQLNAQVVSSKQAEDQVNIALQSERSAHETTRQSLSAEIAELRAQLTSLIATAQAVQHQLQVEQMDHARDVASAHDTAMTMRSVVDDMQNQLTASQQQVSELTASLQQQLAQYKQAEQKLEESAKLLKAAKELEEDLEAQLTRTEQQADNAAKDANEQIDKLRSDLATARAAHERETQLRQSTEVELEKRKAALNVFHETVRQKAADRVKREAAAAEKAKQEKALAEQRAAEEAERLREKQKGFFSSLFTSEQAAPIVPAAANKVPAKPVQAAKPAPLPNGVTPHEGEWEQITPEMEREMEEQVSYALSMRLAKSEEDNWFLREKVGQIEQEMRSIRQRWESRDAASKSSSSS